MRRTLLCGREGNRRSRVALVDAVAAWWGRGRNQPPSCPHSTFYLGDLSFYRVRRRGRRGAGLSKRLDFIYIRLRDGRTGSHRSAVWRHRRSTWPDVTARVVSAATGRNRVSVLEYRTEKIPQLFQRRIYRTNSQQMHKVVNIIKSVSFDVKTKK